MKPCPECSPMPWHVIFFLKMLFTGVVFFVVSGMVSMDEWEPKYRKWIIARNIGGGVAMFAFVCLLWSC